MRIGQKDTTRNKQRGAVSLFIVIFTSLLLVTITISFVQLMTSDQQQASNSDLSESAYDSAMAGVEDAKRLLLLDRDCRNGSADSSIDCAAIGAALTPSPGESQTQCNTLVQGKLVGEVDGETPIRQQAGDNATKLDQAYTCVKVVRDTEDYIGNLRPNATATLIPLRAKTDFNRIIVSWGMSKTGGTVNLPADGNISLPRAETENWPQNRPALLRTQLINGGGHNNFLLTDFDTSSYSNTLFLHPSRVGLPSLSFDSDGRRGALGSEPQPARCNPSVVSGEYACQVELMTNATIPAGNQTAFLVLAASYNQTDFRIQLRNDSGDVAFDNVQPEIDSTGRANDLFRRVVSRIELGNTFTYPVAALETPGNLCKNFSVTTEPDDYESYCTP